MSAPRTTAGRTGALLLAALAASALALGLTLRSAARTRAAGTRIREARRDLARVEDTAREIEAQRRIAAALAETAETARPLQALHRSVFAQEPAELVARERIPAAGGTVRRMEWRTDDASADRVLALVGAGEASRPPWRLESMRLTTVPGGEPGRVRARLVFLGWEPEPPDGGAGTR